MSTIKTARLTLGEIRECDFDALMALFKNEAVAATYMVPDLPTREDETELFDLLRNRSLQDDRFVFGIFLDGSLIGLINDCMVNYECIEMGYAIHPDYQNKGYATEAFGAVIRSILSKSYTEVIAGAFEGNAASIRVMEKCGMKPSKMTSEVDYRGKTHKCDYYSIKK